MARSYFLQVRDNEPHRALEIAIFNRDMDLGVVNVQVMNDFVGFSRSDKERKVSAVVLHNAKCSFRHRVETRGAKGIPGIQDVDTKLFGGLLYLRHFLVCNGLADVVVRNVSLVGLANEHRGLRLGYIDVICELKIADVKISREDELERGS